MAQERWGWRRRFSFLVFFCVVEGRFCRGFCENARPERGFFVVNLWWIDGETWCVDTMFLRSEKHATFSDYFFNY